MEEFINIFLMDDIYLGVLTQEILKNPMAITKDFPQDRGPGSVYFVEL